MRCKGCGKTGLEWVNNGKWMLYDSIDGSFHQCGYKPKPQAKGYVSKCKHGISADRSCPLCEEERNYE